MRSKNAVIFLTIGFLIGVCVLLYPAFSSYVNSKTQTRAIVDYESVLQQMEQEDYTALFQAAYDYNNALFGLEYPLRDYEEVPGYYESLSIPGGDIMGYVIIEKIGVELPLYHGTSDVVLQVAVGHLEGTSLPTGDPNTHVAISAHRGLPSAKLFTNLDQLQQGDIFTLRVLDEVFTYEIDQIVIVLPHEVEVLEFLNDGRAYCSLITCTPYGVNSHRMIVRGHRVENSTAAQAARVTADAQQIDPLIVTPIVAAPMLLVLLIIMLMDTSPKKKAKAAAKHFTTEEIVEAAEAIKTRPINEEGGERP